MQKIVHSIIMVVVFMMLLASAGCSKKNKGGAEEGATEGTATLSDEDLALQNQQRWGDSGGIPNAQAGGQFRDVLFGYDSSGVDSQYHSNVRAVADALRADPTLHVDVEGHCDNRGTSDYNMALGERRAKSVARMLFDLGIPATQISTVSYGEELPLVQGESEDAWSQNRRAHFAVYKKGANSPS